MFDDQRNVVPVTLIEAGPCYVTQLKSKEKDGYSTIQVAYGNKKRINKPLKGHLKELKIMPRYFKEFRTETTDLKIGGEINASVFQSGDIVSVSGVSKGKGFQGAVKRWGFAGRSASHGTKHEHRNLGSVGRRWPQRVTLGRKMPGRMGFERVTVKNLKVIEVHPEKNLIVLRGAVPGRPGTLLEIKE